MEMMGGSAGHRVQGELKVGGKSGCPGNCREYSKKLQDTVKQTRPAPAVKMLHVDIYGMPTVYPELG